MKLKSFITVLLPLSLSCVAMPSQKHALLVDEEHSPMYLHEANSPRDLMRIELMQELASLKDKKKSDYVPKNIETLTQKNFDEKILKNKLPVIVEFSIEGCRYCEQVKPDFDDLCGLHKDEMKCYEINITDAPLIDAKYHLEYFPTFGFFNKSKKMSKHWFEGAVSRRILEKRIKDFLDDVKKEK